VQRATADLLDDSCVMLKDNMRKRSYSSKGHPGPNEQEARRSHFFPDSPREEMCMGRGAGQVVLIAVLPEGRDYNSMLPGPRLAYWREGNALL
jgi:hypothetical protein